MEGEIGVCVWLGAPSIHMMFGLNLAGHWQGGWGHVHFRSHYGVVESWVGYLGCRRLSKCRIL